MNEPQLDERTIEIVTEFVNKARAAKAWEPIILFEVRQSTIYVSLTARFDDFDAPEIARTVAQGTDKEAVYAWAGAIQRLSHELWTGGAR